MDLLRQLATHLVGLFRRRNLEAEMAEEMRQHLERRIQEKIAEGVAPIEARYAAQREFGGIVQVQEQCRDERHFRWLEHGMQDLRYAMRQLRRSPGFTAVAIATLAVGIGATTAIFSVVNGLLLKPLPYGQPGQLVQIFEASEPGDQSAISPGVFFDWREQSTAFEGLAAYTVSTLNFNGGAEPERIDGLRMTANGLQLLRARPFIGRLFTTNEDQLGRGNVVVLTYRLWQRCFGANPDVVGRTVLLDDQKYTVVGVLPDRFLPFSNQEFVLPLVMDASLRERRSSHWLRAFGRLKPGTTIEQAHAELEAISHRIRPLLPSWKQKWGATIVPLQALLVAQIKPALLVLLGAVGLVLLIACANVANLLLAKSATRQREIAVRAALGASRGRIVRQLLVESVCLSLLGATLGVVLASWSVTGLRQLLGTMNIARVHEIALDSGVLGAAAIVVLLTGIGFGLAPALQVSRSDLTQSLKDARGLAGGGRLRGALVIGEVALALVLLTSAGLLLHSFSRLVNVPLGFDPENALTLQLTLSGPRYPENSKRVAFFNRVAESMATLPGVEAAGMAQTLPLHDPPDMLFRIVGRENQPAHGQGAQIDYCTPDYLRALDLPLLQGRMFQASDLGSGVRVAVVNAEFARRYFPGENPVGQYLERENQSWEIVGVVGNVRMNNRTHPIRPLVYRVQPSEGWWSAALVVRTAGAPASAIDGVRRVIRDLDPTQPIANVRPLEEVVSASLGERRVTLGLLGAFSIVALALAAIGLYGVMAYMVAQRTRELGIRMALGAGKCDIVRLVLGNGLALTLTGVILGLAGAFALTRALTKLLYEVRPTDPVTFAATPIVLLLVALLASWLPARRATKIDPMVALRGD